MHEPVKKIPKIGFVSLGCPKAGSDTGKLITQIRSEGYEISPTYDDSDLVIVNTCGFIESAIEESIEAIREARNLNDKVIVTGCLGEKKEIIESHFNNLLGITGSEAYDDVLSIIHEHLPKPSYDPKIDLVPKQGIRITPNHYAYLKISEGCNHSCSFCIIPSMRGKLKSRGVGDILSEAENLVNAGVSELMVISQDTSAYGVDMKYRTGFWNGKPVKSDLYQLAKNLGQLGVWVRLHYVYPYPNVDKLIELMADKIILPYLDVPFQHADKEILKLMRRPASSEDNLKRINEWRQICPEISIRSTFIVGFPGETEEHFHNLIEFIKEAKLDRVGCFKYSNVDGAGSNILANHVSEEIKEERYRIFMRTQEEISKLKMHSKINTIQTVLVDEVTDKYAIARSYSDAPEIDGVIYLENPQGLNVGDMLDVKIKSHENFDLYAGPIN
jgi:ribosomal protein S12 methylthiotransferase